METSTALRPELQRYGIAGLSVVLATAVVHALRPWMGENVPAVVMAPCILIGAWYGGLAAGLVSTLLNGLAAAYLLIPPINSFQIADRSGWLHLAVLAFQGVVISWLCESRRRALVARSQALEEAREERRCTLVHARAVVQANADVRCLANAVLERSAEKMDAFAEDLLYYSRLQTNPKLRSSIDTESLVKSAVARFVGQLQQLEARIEFDGTWSQLEGDAYELLRLFESLIDNAIKFRGSDPLRIGIESRASHDQCLFSVSDNGIGIVPAHWEEVFALGRRLHGDAFSGAGMGLPIAKRIVENHGGRIWLHSEYGQGTTVRFTIPCKVVQHNWRSW
jgi:signal transduction histidine kinase